MMPYKLQRTVSYFDDETDDILTAFKKEFETKNTLVEATTIEPLHISGTITEYIFAENVKHLISIITQIDGISINGVQECFTISDLTNNILFTEEYNLEEITQCTVCGEILLPDDECYTDHTTGESLCDKHSTYDENTGNYHKSNTNYHA